MLNMEATLMKVLNFTKENKYSQASTATVDPRHLMFEVAE